MDDKLSILVVEDGKSQREMLRDFLLEEGHEVKEATNGEEGLDKALKDYFDLMILDYKMPGKNGIEILGEIKRINPGIDVIMMTAYGTIDMAVNAIKEGAADYITKPIDLIGLTLLLKRISESRMLKKENEILREKLQGKEVTTDNIIYKSRSMDEILNLCGRVACSNTSVLLQGESGTGKELMAGLIHNLSPRSERPITVANCSALAENLLESELFGHEKGAFTGAVRRKSGLFEEADKGTLFLDEIGEIPFSLQVKLLRFIQEREFQRVGGTNTLNSDVRIISATNRDLLAMVKEGLFREDLYYRLDVVKITIPPLRERKEDLPLLIDHFLKHFTKENARKIHGISSEAGDLLMKYNYPGNVRELENIIERAVVICRGSVISSRDLPFSNESGFPEGFEAFEKRGLKDSVALLETRLITKALGSTGNNQTRAANLLGISERMIRYKIKKHGIRP